MTEITIRRAEAADAGAVARMANAICAEHGQSPETFSEAAKAAEAARAAEADGVAEGDG